MKNRIKLDFKMYPDGASWNIQEDKLKLNFKMYPYGKSWDIQKNMLNKSKEDSITIYTNPSTFTKVPLSSLEGYFFLFGDGKYKTDDNTTEDFTMIFPRLTLKREKMSSFERKLFGQFVRIY